MSTQKLPITEKNFQAAQKFLDLFEYDVTTIQMMQDRKQKFQGGKILWSGKKGSSVSAFTGRVDDHEKIVADIIKLQNQGFSFWFMVNEGDGIVHEGKETERSQAAVKYLTACFVDTDEGDVKKLEKFCDKRDCPYSLKVNTSPNKFHVYFLLEKCEATEDNLLKWEAIQRTFMAVDKNFDRSMADQSKVLRVPYFYHNKAEPYLVKPMKSGSEVIKYDLDDLYELVGAEKYVKINGQAERFEYPTDKVESGGRHYSLMSYLKSLTTRGNLSRDELIDSGIGFARRNFQDFKIYMPGGERYSQLEHNVDSVLEYCRQEEMQKHADNLDEMREKESKYKASLHFDPQFFYDCPNKTLGDMIKHSASQAPYPCPAYDFAAFVGMFGCLKSHLFISSRGHVPVNYFLCFGPTGVGKSHSQKIVNKTMKLLGENACFFPSLKTEKGLYRALAENNSRVFAMMDEIEDLLAMMTGNKIKVESHTKTLKRALLHLYTGSEIEFKSAPTGNIKEQVFVLNNSHLNLIGYATPDALHGSFTVGSLSDGLFPRFSIITVADERHYNEKCAPKPSLLPGHIKYLRQVVMDGRGIKEESLNEIDQLEKELAEILKQSGKKDEETKERLAEIKEKLSDLRTSGRNYGEASVIPFTEKADKMYVKYIHKINEQYNQNNELVRTVYTRVAEKVGRLATVIAEEKITTQVLEWCIEFADKQAQKEIEACGEDGANLAGGDNWEEKNYKRLIKCIERTVGSDGIASKRDISRNMRLGSTVLDKLLNLGVEREHIQRISDYRRGTDGKKGVGFKPVFEI